MSSPTKRNDLRVLLLGGNSGAGKTTIAPQLATRLGMVWGSVDDYRLVIERVTTLATHPALHHFSQTLGSGEPSEAAIAYRDVSQIVSETLEVVIANHGHDYPVQLMQYELLSRVEPSDASETTFIVVGELAARLHDALGRYPKRDAFVADRRTSANEWGMQNEALWPHLRDLPERSLIPADEQGWLRAVDERVLVYLQQQYPEPVALSLALLHGDLNFEHLQFLPDGTPYLFDFGDMCWGPVAHELGVFFLNTFCGSALSFSHWEAMQQRILAGYRATRPVSQLDEAMIPVFIVNRVLAAARYGVELSQDAQIGLNWNDVKRMYQAAEYLLNRSRILIAVAAAASGTEQE